MTQINADGQNNDRIIQMRIILPFFTVALICFFVCASSAQDKSSYGVSIVRDLVFITRDGEPFKGDLYQPADENGKLAKGPFPAFVLIHGGGFVIGEKNIQFIDVAKWLTKQGYLCFNVNYRLSKGGTFPNSVNDVKCAVKYLRGNAEKFGVDPDRIGVMGGSAGGYLTAFLAATPDHPDFPSVCGEYDQNSSSVAAAVPVYGIYDFEKDLEENPSVPSRKVFEDYVGGGNPDEIKKKFKKASVLTYLKKTDTNWLVIHGSSDSLVPVSQANILHDALKSVGADTELAIIEKGKHGYFDVPGMDMAAFNKTLPILEEWLNKKFPGKQVKHD